MIAQCLLFLKRFDDFFWPDFVILWFHYSLTPVFNAVFVDLSHQIKCSLNYLHCTDRKIVFEFTFPRNYDFYSFHEK